MSIVVGRGNAKLADQLAWWGERGPSRATKSYVDCYTAGQQKTKVP